MLTGSNSMPDTRTSSQLVYVHASTAAFTLCVPDPGLCVDNGAMVAAAGFFRLRRGEETSLGTSADSSLALTP